MSSHVVSKSGDYYVGLENGHVVQAVLGDYGYMGLKLSKSSINDMAFLNKVYICHVPLFSFKITGCYMLWM